MKAEDLIAAKLRASFPQSFEIFEESCLYTIKHNLDFIKGVLLHRESPITHQNSSSIAEQLFSYLRSQGYQYMRTMPGVNFATREGFLNGITFVVFLSKAAHEAYEAETERWNKWASYGGSVFAGEKPKRPIHESIAYLDIYKNENVEK